MEIISCDSPGHFDAALEDLQTKSKTFFILFTGSKDSNGRSWCPDCTAAEPIINDALGSVPGGCKLLLCDVERSEYRQPEYSYRTDARISLKCVPTLMKWSNGKCIARLNDSQSQDVELVSALVNT